MGRLNQWGGDDVTFDHDMNESVAMFEYDMNGDFTAFKLNCNRGGGGAVCLLEGLCVPSALSEIKRSAD